MLLSLDTTNNLKTIVGLGKSKIIKKYQKPQEQELLSLIVKILEKNKKTFKDISEIKVNLGPGSYTGIRVGVAIANALAWSLGIKVNGKKQVVPQYGK